MRPGGRSRPAGRSPARAYRLLLPAAIRPLAAALFAACVVVMVILGALVTHQTRAGWLDTAVEARVRASLGGEPGILNLLVRLGDPIPVTVMTTALVLACLATRRWRGAVLVAVAVPAAGAIAQFVLKPLIDRTSFGYLSFPSGRATSVFALAAAIAVLLADPPRRRMTPVLRLLLALTALLAAAAVAVAVVDEGIHYFTDAVGGAAVGIGVVLLTAFILDLLAAVRSAFWPASRPRALIAARPPARERAPHGWRRGRQTLRITSR